MSNSKYIILKSQLFLSTSLLATCIYKNSYGSDNSAWSDSDTSPNRARTSSNSSNSSNSGASSSGSQNMNLDREWGTRTYIPHFLQNLEAFLIAPEIIQSSTINLARGVEATPFSDPLLTIPEDLLNLMFYEALENAAKELYITPQVSFPGDSMPALSSSSSSNSPSIQQDYKKFSNTSKAVKFNVKMLLLHNIMSEFLGVELNRNLIDLIAKES